MKWQKKRQAAEERQERYEILSKYSEYNTYFAYLPYIYNPIHNFSSYSNADLNNILVALKYGDMDNDPLLAPQRKLYSQFIKEYDQNVTRFINQQQFKMMQEIKKNEKKAEAGKKGNKQQKDNKKGKLDMEQMAEAGWVVNKKAKKQKQGKKQEGNQFDEKRKVYVQKKYAVRIETTQDSISVQNLQQYEQLANFKEKYGLNFHIQLTASQI